jgi:hypothetical protein
MSKTLESKIARRGLLRVNLPITFIIFGSWFALLYTDSLSFQKCAIISGAIGWIYWEFTIDSWISWSLSQGIEKEKLYKIGKRNVLLWSEFRINKVVEKQKEK